jgi:HEAT repeat protein
MNDSTDPAAKSPEEAARANAAALGDIFKALKTIGFYPDGHPLRRESLRQAHRSMAGILGDKELTLVITRSGFTTNDGGAAIENTPMVLSLAKELFLRRTQRLTFLADLTQEDLAAFLALLTLEPQKMAGSNGMENLLRKRGVRTIWANEISLSSIWAKREAMDRTEDGVPDGGLEECPEGEDTASVVAESVEEAELTIDALVDIMEGENDDNRYLNLARLVAMKAEQIKEKGEFAKLLPVSDALIRHAATDKRSVTQKEYAVYTLEQVAGGPATDFLLKLLEDRDWEEPEKVYRIVKHLGGKIVYPIIHRLCIADGLFARKALATALVRIGQPSLAPLVGMLRDERWYVVRNMVAIIGEIGSRECAGDLRTSLYHQDARVRKETIRTLVKLGGREAENLIIDLLADRDASIARQAILSLGIMKSQAAVQALVDIITARDLFLTSLPLKKEAIQALGRIGDRRATPVLLDILETQRWLAWNRWDELRVSAAAALGQLGDEGALPALKAFAGGSGQLGRTCSEAIDTIERLAAEIYE